jgi:hypothetical protein
MNRFKRFAPLIVLAGVIALIFGMGWNRYLSLDTIRDHGASSAPSPPTTTSSAC